MLNPFRHRVIMILKVDSGISLDDLLVETINTGNDHRDVVHG